MNAVDANVLVYAMDEDEPIKHAKANELLNRLLMDPSETIMLWQAAAEFLAVLRRWQDAGHITAQDVQADFRDVLKISNQTVVNSQLDRAAKSAFDRKLLS